MNPIAFDTEAFYSNEVSIKPLGAWHYVRHPQADHYLLTVDDGTGNVWAGRPETFDWDQLRGSRLLAHNMSYDEVVLGALVEQGKAPAWVLNLTRDCTADLAAYCHSERSLLVSTQTLAPDMVKPVSKEIRSYMKGKTWADAEAAGKAPALLEYAKNDARACRELWTRHEAKWPEFERQLSRHTRTVGQRGMIVDAEKVETYRKALELAKWEAERRIPWAGDFPPLSPKQLAQACAQANIPAPASTAEDNPECEKWEAEYGERFDWVAAMRDWRKTNKMLTQVQTIQRRIRPDGTMPIGLKYFGAHTGRWSGESGFNMQNLPREATYGVDLRSVFVAPPGHSLVICDLSQIEPRVLAWLAGDFDLLRSIRGGMAIYEAHARTTMNWTGGELKKEDKKLYSLAKARVLGLGYGCGKDKFIAVAKMMAGLTITPAESERIVKSYRDSNPKVTALWQKLDRAIRTSRGGTFEMELPSGRTLRQFDVVCRENSFWSRATATGHHRRIYGGLAAENCLSGETQVLTQTRGWVQLVEVRNDDLIWDGKNFVAHEGLIKKGRKHTISRAGVRMTPDHRVLTDAGWVEAEKTCSDGVWGVACGYENKPVETRKHGAGRKIPTPDGDGESRVDRSKDAVAVPLRLRNRLHQTGGGRSTQESGVLRETVPPPQAAAARQERNARHVQNTGIRRVEFDAGSVPTSNTPSVEKLRGARGRREPRVGQLPTVLDRHGADLRTGKDSRPNRQLARILQAKLPLGLVETTGAEHAGGEDSGMAAGRGRSKRDQAKHPILPTGERSPADDGVSRKTGHPEEVYDLKNCGPRHCFVVRSGPGGAPFIAHNCTQATARDVFGEALLRVEQKFPVCLHVHDELVVAVPDAEAKSAAAEITRLMSFTPEWLPGCPIAAEAVISKHYVK